MTSALDKLRAIGECAWYQDVDELTGERVWVTQCFGAIDADLFNWANTCMVEADIEHCPFCGDYICETTKEELAAGRTAEDEYRDGVRNGLYGYGG